MDPFDSLSSLPLCPNDQRRAVAQLLALALQRLLQESDNNLPDSSEYCTNELDVSPHKSVNVPTA
jgi:hypothetical protein